MTERRAPHRVAALALLFAFTASCGKVEPQTLPPTGQIVLFVSTDGPLPPPAGEALAAGAPPALFDRIRIETFEPSATTPCRDCSREFELDRIRVERGEASVGIVTKPGVTGYRTRVRLYRGVNQDRGEPFDESTVSTIIELPTIASEGITEVGVFLAVDKVGQPLGTLDAPLPAQLGRPDFSQVGKWAPALRVPCQAAPKAGEACVPGGTFWMGNPAVAAQGDGSQDPIPHLVTLSPFFIARGEVTVADLRASGVASVDASAAASLDPLEAPPSDVFDGQVDPDGGVLPSAPQFFCDYTYAADPKREPLPVNCVSWTAARDFCHAQGGELPTEAQFEYAGSGLESRLYVWGSDDPTCQDAVWGRGGVGIFANANSTCRAAGDPGGPVRAGSGARDQLTLEGGAVVDLAGNLNEWLLDHWNRVDESCWSHKPLLVNPGCATPSPADGDWRTIKGGAWSTPPELLRSASRVGHAPSETRPQTGFRCARSAL